MTTDVLTPEAPVHEKPFTLTDQLLVSCLWFGYNLQWGALLFLVLPAQIEHIVGKDRKEFYLGIVLAIGALVSLVVTPVAGALSDRCRNRAGRRRPFLIAGIAAS